MFAQRLFQDFREGLTAEIRGFSFTSRQARAALGAALAALCAVLLADRLNLHNPYWAGITALVVSRTTYAASLAKGALRVIGTVTGCALALLLVGACIDNTFAMLCLIFFTSTATVLVSAQRGADAYAWSMAGFMIVLISVAGLSIPTGLYEYAFYRTFEISLGTVVAVTMSALVNPRSSADAAVERLATAWSGLARALRMAAANWRHGSLDGDALQDWQRETRSALSTLPGLIFEGRVEGSFTPEQTALASRLGRIAAHFTRRAAILIGDRPALLHGYAGQFAPEVDNLASSLDTAAQAVRRAVRAPNGHTLLKQPAAALRQAVRELERKHRELMAGESPPALSPEETLTWAAFRGFADALAATLDDIASNASAVNAPQKRHAPLENLLVKQAVSLGLALVAVPLIWKYLDLPGAVQIGVTSLVLLQPDPVETWRKGILRLSGCVIGGGIGLLLLGTPVGHSLELWGAAYFILIFLFSYINHGDSRCSYTGLQAGIALTMTLVQGLEPGTSLEPPLTRVCGILAGFALWNVIHTLLGGDSPLQDVRVHMREFLAALSSAVRAVQRRERAQALQTASIRLEAARKAQDLLLWQGSLKAGDIAALQEVLSDADRVMSEAPQALLHSENRAAAVLDAAELSLPALLRRAGQALQFQQQAASAPENSFGGILAELDRTFEADVATGHRLADACGLPPEERFSTAGALMAQKNMLQALASMNDHLETFWEKTSETNVQRLEFPKGKTSRGGGRQAERCAPSK